MSELPEAARKKLSALSIAADEAAVLVNTALSRIKELRDRRANIALDPKAVAEIDQQIADFQASQRGHQERRTALAATVGSIQRWLERQPDFEPARPVAPVLRSGETLDQALERVRKDISIANAQLDATMAAPLPKRDLHERLAGYVRDLAEQGRPKINAERGNLSVSFGNPRAYTQPSSHDFMTAVAWLMPDLLLERLKAELDRVPEPALVLSPAQKAARSVELSDRIDNLERQEEALIERAAAEGRYLARRHNASPAAVLGVTARAAKRRAA
jgi:hypothetical protein